MLQGARERLRELRHAATKRLEYDSFEPVKPGPPSPPPVEPLPPEQPSPFPPSAVKGLLAATDDPTFPLLERGLYGDVVRRFMSVEPTVDQLNNLGCAWAALAVTQHRSDYFGRARTAFEQSKKKATLNSQRRRAEANLALISNIG